MKHEFTRLKCLKARIEIMENKYPKNTEGAYIRSKWVLDSSLRRSDPDLEVDRRVALVGVVRRDT